MDVFRLLRLARRSGGVLLQCHDTFSPLVFQVDVSDKVESVRIKTLLAHHARQVNTIIRCIVYNLPRSPAAPVLMTHLIMIDAKRVRYPDAKFVLFGGFSKLDIPYITNYLRVTKL